MTATSKPNSPTDAKAELRHWFFQKLNPEQRKGFLFAAGIAPKTCDLTLGMQYQAIDRLAAAMEQARAMQAAPDDENCASCWWATGNNHECLHDCRPAPEGDDAEWLLREVADAEDAGVWTVKVHLDMARHIASRLAALARADAPKETNNG